MKKDETLPAGDQAAPTKPIATTAAAAAAPAGDEVPAVTDEGATEGEQLLNPKHDWPTAGGSYVRQADGKLKREDD